LRQPVFLSPDEKAADCGQPTVTIKLAKSHLRQYQHIWRSFRPIGIIYRSKQSLAIDMPIFSPVAATKIKPAV